MRKTLLLGNTSLSRVHVASDHKILDIIPVQRLNVSFPQQIHAEKPEVGIHILKGLPITRNNSYYLTALLECLVVFHAVTTI